MVGTIQKILLDLVESVGGRDAVREVRERAKVPKNRVFRLSEVYDDSECRRLFEVSCDVLKLSRAQILSVYAEAFGKDALKRWPKWFEMSKNSREFLIRQPKIHNYFASGVQDPEARKAINDKFVLEEVGDKTIITHYKSPNDFCDLYVLLAYWVIDHYQDAATVIHQKCRKRGDAECLIQVHWETLKSHI
jgi:hypothetical protein